VTVWCCNGQVGGLQKVPYRPVQQHRSRYAEWPLVLHELCCINHTRTICLRQVSEYIKLLGPAGAEGGHRFREESSRRLNQVVLRSVYYSGHGVGEEGTGDGGGWYGGVGAGNRTVRTLAGVRYTPTLRMVCRVWGWEEESGADIG